MKLKSPLLLGNDEDMYGDIFRFVEGISRGTTALELLGALKPEELDVLTRKCEVLLRGNCT